MRQIKTPESRDHWHQLRSQNINSTEVSALFGISPYTTEFELFHKLRDATILHIEENDRMKWGNRLESAIANGVASDNGWSVRPMKEYMWLDDVRLGASFDFRILNGMTTDITDRGISYTKAIDSEDDAILEIKNVDALIFRDGWEVDDDGNVDAPPHIEIQVQQQLMITGFKKAYIAALVGGNSVKLIERDPDPDVFMEIIRRASIMWERVQTNTPPDPNFIQDAEFIAKLYNFASPGKVMDLKGDSQFMELATRHKIVGDQAKALEEERQSLKAQMLMRIGDSEKVLCDGFTVTAGTVGPVEMAYTREGYRMFRLNWPRKKK